MARSVIWTFHHPDGQYIGQAVAFAAEVAFCACMRLSGTSVADEEVKFEPIEELSGKITYNSSEFVVTGSAWGIYVPALE